MTANPDVLSFYKLLPFNYQRDVGAHIESIRDEALLASYPFFEQVMRPGMRILDVGCGVGWLGLSLVDRYGGNLTGIDFNPLVVERAQEIANTMGVSATFQVADLFKFEPDDRFNIAMSMGVLHHTNDCMGGVRRLCRDFAAHQDSHVVIGLYHTYGRAPFLQHFENMRTSGATNDEMMAEYARLHAAVAEDPVHLESWFRDQVLHPHETQHLLHEVVEIFESEGMELTSCSINRFEDTVDIEELYEQERAMKRIAEDRLHSGVYYPGFFVAVGTRRAPAQ